MGISTWFPIFLSFIPLVYTWSPYIWQGYNYPYGIPQEWPAFSPRLDVPQSSSSAVGVGRSRHSKYNHDHSICGIKKRLLENKIQFKTQIVTCLTNMLRNFFKLIAQFLQKKKGKLENACDSGKEDIDHLDDDCGDDCSSSVSVTKSKVNMKKQNTQKVKKCMEHIKVQWEEFMDDIEGFPSTCSCSCTKQQVQEIVTELEIIVKITTKTKTATIGRSLGDPTALSPWTIRQQYPIPWQAAGPPWLPSYPYLSPWG